MTVSKELLEKRKKMMDDFSHFRHQAQKRYNELKQKRLELRNGVDTSQLNSGEEIEYNVQFLVETKKEEVAE